MKFLLTIILLMNFAIGAERIASRRANKEVTEQNSMRAKSAAFCNKYTNADDKASCLSELGKSFANNVKETLALLISDLRKKPMEELKIEIKEEECIAEQTNYLTIEGQTPVGSTCAELTQEYSDYLESLKGSGSGSGGQ